MIGIDPGFRIAEEGELKLLKQDVLDELLEERYAQEGSGLSGIRREVRYGKE